MSFFYQFPHITRIEPVLEAIKDSDDFRVTEKDGGYKVINYNLASSTTFPPFMKTFDDLTDDQIKRGLTDDFGLLIAADIGLQANMKSAIRRECRGLIFDADGNLIRRAYHKFFNLNEREETLVANVDFDKHHVIMEKIDGSMVTPLWLPDDSNGKPHLRLATKAGITDVSMEAEYFIADKPWYKDFMKLCQMQGLMPIFEYVSPETRIVIKHKEPNLILTAIRNQITGEYFPSPIMRANALYWNIPVVNYVFSSTSPLTDGRIDDIEKQSDTEGVVIRFENGHMLKVKTLWYVAIHRAKDNLLYERRVIELILEDKVDDVIGFLDNEDREHLAEYRDSFVKGLEKNIHQLKEEVYPKAKSMTRKDFALSMGKELPNGMASVIFACWDKSKEDVEGEVLNMVRKSLSSQSKIDKTRHFWDNATWNYRARIE